METERIKELCQLIYTAQESLEAAKLILETESGIDFRLPFDTKDGEPVREALATIHDFVKGALTEYRMNVIGAMRELPTEDNPDMFSFESVSAMAGVPLKPDIKCRYCGVDNTPDQVNCRSCSNPLTNR